MAELGKEDESALLSTEEDIDEDEVSVSTVGSSELGVAASDIGSETDVSPSHGGQVEEKSNLGLINLPPMFELLHDMEVNEKVKPNASDASSAIG